MADPQGGVSEYEDYYRKVELAWSLARGRQIIVSPLEFEEVSRWYDAGVPLPVVLRAIEVFVEKKAKAKRQKGFLLKDAASSVEKCWKEYQDIHEGEGEEGDLLQNKMTGLIGKIRGLTKALPDHATYLSALVQQLRDISLTEVVQFDAIDATLAELEVAMIGHFQEAMASNEFEALREEVSDFLSEEEDPVFFGKMLRDAIRSYFQLPKLTLLG